jgi:hypothetical protein
MKLSVECSVRSNTILGKDAEIAYGEREVRLFVDTSGVWNKVQVVQRVPDPTKVQWGMEPVVTTAPNQSPWMVHANVDSDLYRDIIADIQCLESALALSFPVENIGWGATTMNIIHEEGDPPLPEGWEPISNIRVSRPEPEPKQVDRQFFLAIALLSPQYRPIVVPLSFWREGQNEMNEHKFINAFYNFYFVIEGLYGKGKTKNYQTLEEFKKSKELREYLDEFLKMKHPIQYFEQIRTILAEMKKKPDAEGLIHALVKIRGELHHFTNRQSKNAGSPLTHDNYEAVADLAKFLAHRALTAAMLKMNNETRPKFPINRAI